MAPAREINPNVKDVKTHEDAPMDAHPPSTSNPSMQREGLLPTGVDLAKWSWSSSSSSEDEAGRTNDDDAEQDLRLQRQIAQTIDDIEADIMNEGAGDPDVMDEPPIAMARKKQRLDGTTLETASSAAMKHPPNETMAAHSTGKTSTNAPATHLPLHFPKALANGAAGKMILVETDRGALDLRGDIGVVGRVGAPRHDSKSNGGIQIDMKGRGILFCETMQDRSIHIVHIIHQENYSTLRPFPFARACWCIWVLIRQRSRACVKPPFVCTLSVVAWR